MAKRKSPKPTGLVVVRNGENFTLGWKVGGKDYKDGQKVEYSLDGEKTWTSVSGITHDIRSKEVTIARSKFYPNSNKPTLDSIVFRVAGNQKAKIKKKNPIMSDWSTVSFTPVVPPNPSIQAVLDDTLTNKCVFSWDVAVDLENTAWFTNTEYESLLVKESNITDGSKIDWVSTAQGWQTGTKSDSDSVTITEDTSLLAQGSWTRWVRVRSRGPKGDSSWKYAKHVYAIPYQAKVTSIKAEETEASGFLCTVKWKTSSNAAHPIDRITLQYTITTPDANLQCPSGASWTDANISAYAKGNDAAVFSIDDLLSNDQCLFIRVNTVHDSNITYGAPIFASSGVLTSPSGVSVSTNNTTHKATISATNNSAITDSFLAVIYRTQSKPDQSFIVGVIPNGSSSVTVQCPDWSSENTTPGFGVYAVVGAYTAITRADNADCYVVKEKMRSAGEVWKGGSVPSAPTGITVSPTEIPGTILVTWNWDWEDADSAEISWSDHPDAWESTDQPSVYEISQLHASKWNISDLETGIKWYIRVRLISGTESEATYGPWSELVSIDLSSAPSIPNLVLSDSVITKDGSVTASWAYSTTDGTPQVYAEICEATITSQGITYGRIIAHTEASQSITINAKDVGWVTGNTYNLCVRVVSGSGKTSDGWSDPVSIAIARQLSCSITQTSLVTETITVDGTSRTVKSLKALPLTVSVSGAGAGASTSVEIQRAEDYFLTRPNEDKYIGFKGETIAIGSRKGEGQITISNFIGKLDDGAKYRIIATIKDGLGQSAESSPVDFEVHWTHQALIPEFTLSVDQTNLITFITPVAPEGAIQTDKCDIYRLSADKPELIIEDGEFGTTYVDPYPALGDLGGHRIVFKTAEGDYITEDNMLAWVDTTEATEEGEPVGTISTLDYDVINFDNHEIQLYYNTEFSSSWKKDFIQKKYLGGSVRGYWNPAIERTGSLDSFVIVPLDQDMIKDIRRLAEYAGICHVRTTDGSSYSADIQVSTKRSYSDLQMRDSYSFEVSRVDSQGLDGMTYAEWIENLEESEEEEE